MKYRREPKVAPDRQKADRGGGPRSSVYIVIVPWWAALEIRQTPFRMVVASVCEVNSQLPPPSNSLAACLLAARLHRERHRPLGNGRLKPDAGGLPLRPACALRLRPGAEDRRSREQRPGRPPAALPGHRAADSHHALSRIENNTATIGIAAFAG